MSLFQCEVCGCVENTALASQGCSCAGIIDCFDWKGFEGRKGKMLCSAPQQDIQTVHHPS